MLLKSRRSLRFIYALIVCIILGVGIGYSYVNYLPSIVQWFSSKYNYQTSNLELMTQFQTTTPIRVKWSELIPQSEKEILRKYQQTQATSPTDLTTNILKSIEAASDPDYALAMNSVNTVSDFDNSAIELSGFIVPIDYKKQQSPSNIFIVPYFGACIHFPPPPPNQIVFAQLDAEFKDFDLTQAYKLKGVLTRGLFEDPLGTSAYMLKVVSIEPYYQEPDDFRQHDE